MKMLARHSAGEPIVARAVYKTRPCRFYLTCHVQVLSEAGRRYVVSPGRVRAAAAGALEEEPAVPEGLPEDLGELQGEDTGLGLLARRVAAEAMDGAEGDARPSGSAADAGPPELQHLQVG